MSQRNNRYKEVIIPLVCLVIAIGAVVAWLLFTFVPKETHTSDDNQTEAIGILYCSSESPTEDVFFVSDKASGVKHEIKVSFIDGIADKINYTYTGNFDSGETAESTLSFLQGKYNIYMAETGVHFSDLYPTFSVFGTSGVINLFFQEKTITPKTVKIVFLSSKEFANIKTYSIDDFKRVYETKNFVCSTNM